MKGIAALQALMLALSLVTLGFSVGQANAASTPVSVAYSELTSTSVKLTGTYTGATNSMLAFGFIVVAGNVPSYTIAKSSGTEYSAGTGNGATNPSGTFETVISDLEPNTDYTVFAYFRDEGDTASSAGFFTTPSEDAPPNLSPIADQWIRLNDSTDPIAIVVEDDKTAITALSVSANSSNPSVIENIGITLTETDEWVINVNPKAVGDATVTVFVTDEASSPNSVSTSFVVHVWTDPVAETLAASGITYNGATVQGEVIDNGGDSNVERGVVYAVYSNPTVSDAFLVEDTGTGVGAYNASLTGLSPQTTYYVRAYARNDLFTVYANEISFTTLANSLPTITPIGNQVIVKNGSTGTLSFTIADTETSAADLTVTAASDNPSVVSNAGISLGGSGGSRTATIVPVQDAIGTTTVTLTVSDGSGSASISFDVKVITTPTVTTDFVNASITTASVGASLIADGGDTVTEMGVVYGTSLNPTLADHKVTASPIGIGSYDVLLTGLTSGGTVYHTRAFATNSQGTVYGADRLIVTLNAPPAITPIADQSIVMNKATGALAFTVSDAETLASELVVTASSSDTTVVAPEGITINGTAADRTVTVVPVQRATGTTTITLTVDDGGDSAATSFEVKVNAPPPSAATPTPTQVRIIISDPLQGGAIVQEPITSVIGGRLSLTGVLQDAKGNPLPVPEIKMDSQGNFILPNVPAGEYGLVLYVIAPTGEKLAGNHGRLVIDGKGNATFTADLIDPYGTVTDSVTGKPVEGAKLTLHWSDTDLNRSKGRTPGDLVVLPELPDFAPNRNLDPQFSDQSGQYGWMVFPDGDYYIVAEKEGYETFDSRSDKRGEKHGDTSYIRDGIIHVGDSIVKYDLTLHPKIASSGNHAPYMRGYPDGGFRPDRGITRAEVAAILSRIIEDRNDAAKTEAFADVKATHWASAAIETAVRQRWMSGYRNGKFAPEQFITRAELAQVLVNISGWTTSTGGSFPDTRGHWAEAAVATAQRHGLLSGYADGTFRPDRDITRAEAVTMFNKWLGRRPWDVGIAPRWSDVPETNGFYDEIMEASVPHAYDQFENGSENWTTRSK